MRKFNAFALALSLIACGMVSILLLPYKTESRSRGAGASFDPTTIYDYETSLGTGGGSNAIRLSYDPVTDKLVVAVFEDGDGAVYTAEDVTDPVGTYYMEQGSVYDDGTGVAHAPVNSIEVRIDAIDATEATFSVAFSPNSKGDYIAPKVEEFDLQHRYGVCSNPNGTGACDQVHTRLNWWRCFVCCFYGGGCGA